MGKVRTWGFALVVFGSLTLFTSTALAQTCTPVVYVFRHAEDTNPPNPPGPIFALTPTGQAHAALYPTMVSDFEAANNFCKVAKVYATTIEDKVGDCGSNCKSATNAFCTARPMACFVATGDASQCTSSLADPTVCTKKPIDPKTAPMTQVAGNQLYEYLGNGNNEPSKPNYSTPVAKALREELLATARGGKSSAIFWTSQGMHVLGGVIINAATGSAGSNLPAKNGNAIPPRNSAYIFQAVGSDSTLKFSDTPLVTSRTAKFSSLFYLQCFNHVEPDPAAPPPVPRFTDPYYFCGFDTAQSNLGGKPPDSCDVNVQCGTIHNDENSMIKGKICNTTALMPPASTSIFGRCP
jgi:hypothetical protein